MLFQSNLMGGFECSSHRRNDGRRLDLIDATGHERFAYSDYALLSNFGIKTVRDGLRWHLIEKVPEIYDFSSVTRQMQAAEQANVQVIWDLFHYGYPDDLDIFSDAFVDRFADYAAAFTQYHIDSAGRHPYVVPINEISFFSWIAGDVGQFYPYTIGRGDELKMQLARAAIAGIKAIKSVAPDSRIVAAEPAINVKPQDDEPLYWEVAESYRLSQYEAFDMISGSLAPELGGAPELLDIIGVNYYPHNQWVYPSREMIPQHDPNYRPLNQILNEVYERYRRPIFISETGTEGDARGPWMEYILKEYDEAKNAGVDLNGVCIYPIFNHPGWVDERHCHNGLWDYPNEIGEREICQSFASSIEAFRI